MLNINMFKPGDKWKIIFLDVYGVIYIGKDNYNHFNKDALDHLKWIIEQTGAKIVISSSWREGDLEKTKLLFPEWIREHIIDETIRYYSYIKPPLKVCRGNEIATWVDQHLDYPWKAWPEVGELYTIKHEDGSFQKMKSNWVGIDYTYVIIDDDIDMMYFQKDWFVNTDADEGLTRKKAEECVKILNRISINKL